MADTADSLTFHLVKSTLAPILSSFGPAGTIFGLTIMDLSHDVGELEYKKAITKLHKCLENEYFCVECSQLHIVTWVSWLVDIRQRGTVESLNVFVTVRSSTSSL